MAITIPTYDQVVAFILASYRNRFPGKDLSTESYLGKQSRAEAMAVFQILQSVANADADAVPSSRTSDAGMDLWATAIGLISSISGSTITYGRKGSTASLGSTGTATGTNATSIPDGSLLTSSDGVTQFKLNNGGAPLLIPGVAPGTGSATATIDAVTAGAIGNLTANAILTWASPPVGLDTTLKITAPPTTLGIDSESTPALFARVQTKMQAPAKGGTSADYRTWAESVSGVARGYPYPSRGGLGTVHICAVGSGTGTVRKPTSTVQTNVGNYINGSSTLAAQRPVTVQGYSTLLPYMPAYGAGVSPANSGGLTIKCRLVPSKSKYNFDWTELTTYTVATYTAGTNGAADTMTLTQTLPATLTNAINNKTNPRLQILVSTAGGPAAPLQVQVTKLVSTTLTLQNPLPTGWVVPTVGDAVYAGGPMVTPINTALLAYVDSLGPSRAGGYAEAVNDNWEDTCAIDRILQICLATADTDGTRFAKDAFGGGITYITVANGTNAAASTNIQASDTTVNGPELLWTKWIAVVQ